MMIFGIVPMALMLVFALLGLGLAPMRMQPMGHCGSCGAHSQHQSHSSQHHAEAADLALVSLAGDTWRLSEHRGKHPLALFVAGTDSASADAARVVEKAYASRPDDLALYAILKAKKDPARAFARAGQLTFPILLDPQGKALGRLMADTMPIAVFLDRTGTIVKATARFTEETMTKGMNAAAGSQQFKDPVCGMTVTQSSAVASYEYQGTTYYFCNPACRDAFKANPGKYLK